MSVVLAEAVCTRRKKGGEGGKCRERRGEEGSGKMGFRR